MGIFSISDLPSAHAFRASRRHAAIKRKDTVLLQYRVKVENLQSEVDWWRLWWDSWSWPQLAGDEAQPQGTHKDDTNLTASTVEFGTQTVRSALVEDMLLQNDVMLQQQMETERERIGHLETEITEELKVAPAEVPGRDLVLDADVGEVVTTDVEKLL